MSVETEVLVIGAGAAGVSAARAAHEAGVSVAIVDGGSGATAMGSGLAWGVQTAQWHRWATGEGFHSGGSYATVSGWLVAGAVGALGSILNIETAPLGKVLGVVAIETHPSWSARLVAQSLGAVVIEAEGAPEGETFGQTARGFDTDGIAEGFAGALRAKCRDVYALLMPPVLGFRRDDVAERMSGVLGISVGETAGGPGDPTGLRMERALRGWLSDGVKVLRGRAKVVAGRKAVVTVDGESVKCSAVVLATGGLTGGGLEFDGTLSETTAGAPVWTRHHERVVHTAGALRGADPVEWFGMPDGKSLGAGLRVDGSSRVLDATAAALFSPWLFAAGALLVGHGDQGLCDTVETGAAAGRAAARFVRGG